ncbi:MAG: hypothetical protein ABIP93_02925 [Gemmatimonadaceae bacterium]
MRSLPVRLLLPVLLFASFAAPSSARALPLPAISLDAPSAAVGIYRLTLTAKNRAPKTLHMILRDTDQGLSGVLLDGPKEFTLLNARFDGHVFLATIMTSEGAGELSLTLSPEIVSGTLNVGRDALAVVGEHFP